MTSQPTGRLSGKVVLITGAGRGQGAAHARLAACEGATVIVTDVREDEAAAVAAAIGPSAWHCWLDVSDAAGWDDVFTLIAKRHGRLDGLVNNAGIAVMADLAGTDESLFARIIAINQTGTYLGMQRAATMMKQGGGGSIVNISSIAGVRADALFFAYTGSKWAVRGMSRAAARSLAPDRIRVNVVLPGIIDTPMLTEAVPGLDPVAFAAGAAPLGRIGQGEDVSAAVVYLLSDESAYVTGTEITVDGGVTA